MVTNAIDRIHQAKRELTQLRNLQGFQLYNRKREKYFLNVVYPPINYMTPLSDEKKSEIMTFQRTKKTALYFHIPFCSYHCSFCHYYKLINRSLEVVQNYLQALYWEIDTYAKQIADHQIHSIYFGGGTPGYLNTEQIATLLKHIRDRFNWTDDIEVTFEMDPFNSSKEKLEALAAHGCTRLSIGIQSFHDDILAASNRRHTKDMAIQTFEQASKLSFKSVNIDLIYGLIHQTLEHWQDNLEYVERYSPDAVTFYYLRVKHGTPTAKQFDDQRHLYATEEELLLMNLMTEAAMEDLGYTAPVVDYFVKDLDNAHQFDIQVWGRPEDYNLVGLGVSSYSYSSGYQYYNLCEIKEYNKTILNDRELPIWKGYKLSVQEQMRRNLFLALKVGISEEYWKRHFSISLKKVFPEELIPLIESNMLHQTDDFLTLTRLGRLFADEVGQEFIAIDNDKVRGSTP